MKKFRSEMLRDLNLNIELRRPVVSARDSYTEGKGFVKTV
jgi:hypothetical protein